MNADATKDLIGQQLAGQSFTAIAIGTGPSFFDWLKRPRPPAVLYGCGIASHYINLDVYCLNSTLHKENVPKNSTIFAKMRTIDRVPGAFLWPETWPIARQAGGMCVQLAAANHHRIGLVGFCEPISPEIDAEFRVILEFWKDHGRVFVSLMGKSAFDDLLEVKK